VADRLAELFALPPRVFPLVGLVLGFPDESPPPRPRIPTRFCLFRDTYHDLTDEEVAEAMEVMDAGLLREGYYARLNARIPLPDGREDPVGYEDYGWSEHVSRKYGEYGRQMTSGLLERLRRQGIHIASDESP
ncbi:MAG TPA: hypothetical protein DGR79_03145, partial [Clostridiales bacterium]|nr:hypothetical protein [Clostridiales bacterium]